MIWSVCRLTTSVLLAAVLLSAPLSASAETDVRAAVPQSPPSSLQPLIAALRPAAHAAGAEQQLDTGLTAGNWRVRLHWLLAHTAAMNTTRSITRPVHGQLLAGTLRLPTRLVLDGDTTIVASGSFSPHAGCRLWAATRSPCIRSSA